MKSLILARQAGPPRGHYRKTHIQAFTNFSSTMLQSQGTKTVFRVEVGQFHTVESAYLKFDIAFSDAVVLAPGYLWYDRLSWRANQGSKFLHDVFPHTSELFLCCDQHPEAHIVPLAGGSATWSTTSHGGAGTAGAAAVQQHAANPKHSSTTAQTTQQPSHHSTQ